MKFTKSENHIDGMYRLDVVHSQCFRSFRGKKESNEEEGDQKRKSC
jgi:hypothetical protein